MEEITTIPTRTGLSVFDQGAFSQMGLIAQKLSESSLVPDSLKGKTDEETAANCFRVVEQAQRWGLSPFAVMDSASVVHGKLMWEGKLIHAAITASLGIRLKFEYEGEGENRKITVTGHLDGHPLTVEGTVRDWKTTGKGSPWDKLANRDQMLAYRGARQWARRHAPDVILGVYSTDEEEPSKMRNVTPESYVRETPIEPGPIKEEPEEQPEEPAKVDPKPTKVEATGRQKKDRHQRDCILKDITEAETEGGKRFWLVVIDVGKTTANLRTFSSTMQERLAGLINTPIKVTFTTGPRGSFDLEDFEVLETQQGGDLI